MTDLTGAGEIVAGASPWGSLFGAGLNMLGGALGGSPAGPSNATSLGTIGGANFDHSGWNVTFGNESGINAERTEQGELTPYLPYLVVGAVFLVAWRYVKKA